MHSCVLKAIYFINFGKNINLQIEPTDLYISIDNEWPKKINCFNVL